MFNRATLCVTYECPLRCFSCPCHNQQIQTETDEEKPVPLFQDVTRLNSFGLSSFFSQKKLQQLLFQHSIQDLISLWEKIQPQSVFDLMGGDPFFYSDLPQLLTFLKSKDIRTRLWTTGIAPVELMVDLSHLIHEFFIYIPSLEPEIYAERTGFQYLEQVLDSLQVLLDHHKKVTINCPVYPDTIQEMPTIYEFARGKQIPVCFHYSQKYHFMKESLPYLQRFNRVRGAYVFEIENYSATGCIAYPNHAQNSRWVHMKNWARFMLKEFLY